MKYLLWKISTVLLSKLFYFLLQSTVAAILCMSASCLGAPQGNNPRSLFSFTKTNSYDSFGLPTTGKHITNQGAQGPSWNLNFGKYLILFAHSTNILTNAK